MSKTSTSDAAKPPPLGAPWGESGAALAAAPAPRRRLRVGQLEIDVLTFAGALDAIEALVDGGAGGAVFTPNVDHVVTVEDIPEFQEAYAAASLSLVDGTPLLWASRLLGAPLPEKISGSDIVEPLVERAARRRWSVYLLGGQSGAAERAAAELERRFGVAIAGIDCPRIDLGAAGEAEGCAAAARVRAARPELLLVGLGAPKQELWIHRHREEIRPTVALGCGASIDFLAGMQRRAPRWMSRCGLEWLYRLLHEPRRLWRRYLVNDPRFLKVLLRSRRTAMGTGR